MLSPTLGLTFTGSAVWGVVPPGVAPAELRVLYEAEDGSRAEGDTRVLPGEPVWRVYLANEDGEEVEILPHGRLQVRIGDQGVDLRVPDLRLCFDRSTGTLRGQIAERAGAGPGTWELAVSTGNSPPTSRRGRSVVLPAALDADGSGEGDGAAERSLRVTSAFSLPLGPGSLNGGLPITVTAQQEGSGLRLAWERTVPWVRASLHPGDVTGAMRPRSEIGLVLRGSDGRVRGLGSGVTDTSGRFSIWPRDDSGRRVRPMAGDRLRVRELPFPELQWNATPFDEDYAASEGPLRCAEEAIVSGEIGASHDEVQMTVPPLSGSWDLDDGLLWGPGLPGAEIETVMWNPWHPGEVATPSTVVAADGRWELAGQPLHPATHFYLTENLFQGDQAYYCQQIPMLYLEPGSPLVEVQTLWEVEAALELLRDDRVVARAEGGGPWSGNLLLVLRGPGEAAVPLLPGDRLRGRLDGAPFEVPVGRFEARLSPSGGAGGAVIEGLAEPGARVGLAVDQRAMEDSFVTAGPDGRFRLDAAEHFAGGQAVAGEIVEAFVAAGEHNLRARFVGPTLEARLGPGLAEGEAELGASTAGAPVAGAPARGRAQPGARVALVLRRADGSEAQATALADATGAWSADFGPGASPMLAGDRLTMRVGDWETTLELPSLTAELDQDAARIQGTTTPDGLVTIEAYLDDSPVPDRLSAFADEDGRWTVDLGDRGDGTGRIDPGSIGRLRVEAPEDAHAAWLEMAGPAGPAGAVVP